MNHAPTPSPPASNLASRRHLFTIPSGVLPATAETTALEPRPPPVATIPNSASVGIDGPIGSATGPTMPLFAFVGVDEAEGLATASANRAASFRSNSSLAPVGSMNASMRTLASPPSTGSFSFSRTTAYPMPGPFALPERMAGSNSFGSSPGASITPPTSHPSLPVAPVAPSSPFKRSAMVSSSVTLSTTSDSSTAPSSPNQLPSGVAQPPLRARYKKIGKLGEGGCGVVYIVEREVDNKRFAAKVVPLSRSNERKRQYALAEPEVMSRLRSPFVVQYEDHWTDFKQSVVTVMELINGVDLCTHIKLMDQRRQFHMQQVRRLARGLPPDSPSTTPPQVPAPPTATPPPAPWPRSAASSSSSPNTGNSPQVVPFPAVSLDDPPEPGMSPLRMQQLERKNPEIRRHIEEANAAMLSESAAMFIFVQILVGIQMVHAQGVLHCDLTSGNVFICRTGLIKIGDLGLSCAIAPVVTCPPLTTMSAVHSNISSIHSNDSSSVRSETPRKQSFSRPFLAASAVGTPCYMAPELWCTEEMPPYSEKSDMFALGVILFELLTGRRPFHRPTLWETGASVLAGVPVDIHRYAPGTSAEVVHLVHRLLAVNVEHRLSAHETLCTSVMQQAVRSLLGLLEQDRNLDPLIAAAAKQQCQRVLITTATERLGDPDGSTGAPSPPHSPTQTAPSPRR